MKRKLALLTAILGIAAVASPVPLSAKNSKREFKKALVEEVGSKKGNGALRAALKVLNSELKKNPDNAPTYVKLTNVLLGKLLKPNQKGNAAAALVKVLGLSYFHGQGSYDPADPAFQAVLTSLVASLPDTLKTEEGLAPILAGLEKLNKIKKGTAEDFELLKELVYTAAGLIPEEEDPGDEPPVDEPPTE